MSDNRKKKKGKGLPVEEAFKILNYLFGAILLTFSSRRHIFPASGVFPEADVEVNLGKTVNGDCQIDLLIENLRNAEEVLGENEELVAWAEAPDVDPIPLGVLEIIQDKSSFTTTLPAKPKAIFISIEEKNKPCDPTKRRIFESGEICKN